MTDVQLKVVENNTADEKLVKNKGGRPKKVQLDASGDSSEGGSKDNIHWSKEIQLPHDNLTIMDHGIRITPVLILIIALQKLPRDPKAQKIFFETKTGLLIHLDSFQRKATQIRGWCRKLHDIYENDVAKCKTATESQQKGVLSEKTAKECSELMRYLGEGKKDSLITLTGANFNYYLSFGRELCAEERSIQSSKDEKSVKKLEKSDIDNGIILKINSPTTTEQASSTTKSSHNTNSNQKSIPNINNLQKTFSDLRSQVYGNSSGVNISEFVKRQEIIEIIDDKLDKTMDKISSRFDEKFDKFLNSTTNSTAKKQNLMATIEIDPTESIPLPNEEIVENNDETNQPKKYTKIDIASKLGVVIPQQVTKNKRTRKSRP